MAGDGIDAMRYDAGVAADRSSVKRLEVVGDPVAPAM